MKGKPLGCRGLSAARRSCDEDYLHAAAAGIYLVGDVCILPFMQGFRKIDQVYYLPGQNLGIKLSYATNTHDRTPVGVFLQGCCKLGLTLHRKYPVKVAVHRILKAESVIEAHYVEGLEAACRRSKRSVEGISLSVKKVHVIVQSSQCLEQVYLLYLVVSCKYPFTFFEIHHLLAERQVSLYHPAHTGHDFLKGIVSQETWFRTSVFHRVQFPDLAIQTAWQRVIYGEYLVRKHLPHDILKDEAE